jgi:hypothetical protein
MPQRRGRKPKSMEPAPMPVEDSPHMDDYEHHEEEMHDQGHDEADA